MSREIGVLDYGMGNINSVLNALSYLGYDPVVVNSPDSIERLSHLIIPGVGAYSQAMSNIVDLNIITAIKAHVRASKPLLGICLGMQILSNSGEENEISQGLGFIPGHVGLLNVPDLVVPHVGWNALSFHFDHPICSNLKQHVDFYFVHSYIFEALDESNVLATSEYGKTFPAIIVKENVVGIQFHPEKSQDNGLLLIENFCEWDGLC